ncbi:MAG: LysM peptidoglycan-binding domain-containing protein [Planctomycetota bacterium]|nr:MAG: LysM peptidoglycan-binding domain-containing protein [Planctomycetota bacterium]
MRNLLLLGGVLVVLLVAWILKMQGDQTESGNPDPGNLSPETGELTLGVNPEDHRAEPAAFRRDPASEGGESQPNPPTQPGEGSLLNDAGETGNQREVQSGDDSTAPPAGELETDPSAPPAGMEQEGPEQESGTEAGSGGNSPSAGEALSYTVQKGDTLYAILRRCYGKADKALVAAVAEANALASPGDLEIGQVLQLPQVEGYDPPSLPAGG